MTQTVGKGTQRDNVDQLVGKVEIESFGKEKGGDRSFSFSGTSWCAKNGILTVEDAGNGLGLEVVRLMGGEGVEEVRDDRLIVMHSIELTKRVGEKIYDSAHNHPEIVMHSIELTKRVGENGILHLEIPVGIIVGCLVNNTPYYFLRLRVSIFILHLCNTTNKKS